MKSKSPNIVQRCVEADGVSLVGTGAESIIAAARVGPGAV